MDTTQAQDRPISQNYKSNLTKQASVDKVALKVKNLAPKEVELQYRIFSYTSQEEDGKAENLALGTDYDGNPGWHSKRF